MTTLSKTTFAAALLAATMISSAGFAAESAPGPYIAGQVGINLPTGDDGVLDNAAAFAGAAGYRFNPNVRIEGELSYRKNDASEDVLGVPVTGNTKITTAMVNGWYDFANDSAFTPYIGGGLGVAHGSAKATALGVTVKESDSALVWQAGAGVGYALNDQVALTADYRYLDTSTFDDIGADYRAHEVRAGVRYSF